MCSVRPNEGYQAYVALQSMMYTREKELQMEMSKCQVLEASLAALELAQSLKNDKRFDTEACEADMCTSRSCIAVSQGEMIRSWLSPTQGVSSSAELEDALLDEEALTAKRLSSPSLSIEQFSCPGSLSSPIIVSQNNAVTDFLTSASMITFFSYTGKKVEQRLDYNIQKVCTITENIHQITHKTLVNQQKLFLLFLIPYLSIEMEEAMLDCITEKSAFNDHSVSTVPNKASVDHSPDATIILNETFAKFHQRLLTDRNGDATTPDSAATRTRSQEVYKTRLHQQRQKICQLLQNGWPFTDRMCLPVSK